MKKLNNSNFVLIQDIINDLNISYNADEGQKKEELFNKWEDIIGEKISKYSKLTDILPNGTAVIKCSDSFVANELYFEKEKILHLLVKESEKMGIIIKDIKFDYKKWKERIYE